MGREGGGGGHEGALSVKGSALKRKNFLPLVCRRANRSCLS